jgi:alcohol dehydrogenase
MRRLLWVVDPSHVNLAAMITHRFKLDDIEKAYDLLARQRDGVLTIAITH